MSLIQSISGIRGTIGGEVKENLTPPDIVKFSAAYAVFIRASNPSVINPVVCVGRDARISGPMVSGLVIQTLIASGIDVIDLGLSTTPTVEMAVPHYKAHGGIILTASHNPAQWNALKLLNHKGEFISAAEGQRLLEVAAAEKFHFVGVEEIGKIETNDFIPQHIVSILNYPLVRAEAVREKKLKVVVDAVNSTGGIAVPMLLEKLGVEVICLYCTPNGQFPHNPEPLPEHLTEISKLVKSENADLGIVVDPDVDRLALVCEDGTMFGEEYTLVAIADYILQQRKGDTVSNLSSSRALKDVTEKHGGTYHAAAVGEVNVVEKMKSVQAVIGGEGNGGIIVPDFHYGRDALIGIALFLSHYAEKGMKASTLRKSYPDYFMSKKKVDLRAGMNTQEILDKVKETHADYPINLVDGVKIEFERSWVHLRRSNTEPIIRVYTEAVSQEEADALAGRYVDTIKELAGIV